MKRSAVRYIYVLLVLMFTGFFVSGCGGDGNTGHWDSAESLSIAVTPATSSVPVGATRQFVATATFADGTSRVVTEEASWASGTPGIATVNSASGLATGVSAGSALITATFDGKSGSATLTVTAVTLNSIAVTPATSTIPSGLTQTFVATGAYSDGTSQNLSDRVVWSSNNTSIATVASPGVATGLSAGSAMITATFDGKSGSATLTVTAATLNTIAVTPATATIPSGLTQTFVATGAYSDGSSQNLSDSVIWSSDDVLIATVASPGVATGVSAGSASITATLDGKSGSTTLTVTDGTLESIEVLPAQATIAVDGTQTFVATGAFSDGTTQNLSDSVIWSSDATLIATVASPGVATGVSVGSVLITATLADMSGSATLTVTDATLESIEVLPAQATIAVDESQIFVAMGTYSDGSSQDLSASVDWSSDNTQVATVVSPGAATGLLAGTAMITATVADTLPLMEGSAELIVTDEPIAEPVVNLASAATYGVFGGTAGMTNTGVQTVIHGDIGTIATAAVAITGFHDATDIYTETPANIGSVTGVINTCAPSLTNPVNAVKCAAATQARLDAQQAYLALVAMPSEGVLAGNLAGTTLTAGVYTNASSVLIQGGDLTLSGTADDVWVFQIGSTLTVGGPGAAFPQSIILAGGAQAKNVFWQVGTFATINAGGGGTMVGTIISQEGVSFSTAGNTDIVTLNGRALSLGASVTMVDTVINVPAP